MLQKKFSFILQWKNSCIWMKVFQSYLEYNLFLLRLLDDSGQMYHELVFSSWRALSVCLAASPVGADLSWWVRVSVFWLCRPLRHAGVFLYLRGWFLEAPIQKLPEDTFTTVSGGCWGKAGKGVGEWDTRALKFMCPYRAAESQGVPVTHNESFPDSLSSS